MSYIDGHYITNNYEQILLKISHNNHKWMLPPITITQLMIMNELYWRRHIINIHEQILLKISHNNHKWMLPPITIT